MHPSIHSTQHQNLLQHLLTTDELEDRDTITLSHFASNVRERKLALAGDDPTANIRESVSSPRSITAFATRFFYPVENRKEHEAVKKAIFESIGAHYGLEAAELFKKSQLSYFRASSPLTQGALKDFESEVLQPRSLSEFEGNSCALSQARVSETDFDEENSYSIPVAGNYELHNLKNLEQVTRGLENQLNTTQDIFANDQKEDSGNLNFHFATAEGVITDVEEVFKTIAKEMVVPNDEEKETLFIADLKKIFNQGLFSSAAIPFATAFRNKATMMPTGACHRPTVREMNTYFAINPLTKKLMVSVTGSKKVTPEELSSTGSTTCYYQAEDSMVRLALTDHVVSSSTTMELTLSADPETGHITPQCTSVAGSWRIRPKVDTGNL